MYKILNYLFAILLCAGLYMGTAQGQGVPGKDRIVWWLNTDSAGVNAQLTLDETTKDSVYFDFRPRVALYKSPNATYTGSFNLWITVNSLEGDPDITLRYYPLTTNQALGVIRAGDYKPIFNERWALEGFNIDDNRLYGPIKIYCEEAFGLMFIGWNGDAGDSCTVDIKIAIGSGLNMPVSPYSDGVRYFNEYTNSVLGFDTTDVLNIDIPLGNSEGYTGCQFTVVATGTVDSAYASYTPYTMYGTLATNRTIEFITQAAFTNGNVYDYSFYGLPPCNKVRLTFWLMDCTDDSVSIADFTGAVRYKMGSGK